MSHSTRAQDSSQETPSHVATITCIICHVVKPLSEFYPRKDGLGDGYYHTCNECRKAKARQSYERKRLDVLTQKKQYYLDNKQQIAERRRTPEAAERRRERASHYRENNRDRIRAQHRAHRAILNAVAAGDLPDPKTLICFRCGNEAIEYHHHNGYASEHWLDVVPICRGCHTTIHVGIES